MWPNTPFPPPSRAMKPSDWTPCFADQVNDLMDKRADLSFPSPSDTHSPTCFFGLPPRMGSIRSSAVRFAADSAPEGDGFEPSVPHKKTTLFGCPRSVPQFAFRNKNRLFRAGTDGSNPSPSCGESPANLSFRRIEVQGRSREAAGDSRGGEHQGCAAVQQLTASPAADATESNVSLARPEPLYEFKVSGECPSIR